MLVAVKVEVTIHYSIWLQVMEFLKEKSGLCANLEKQIAALTLQVMREFSFFQVKFKPTWCLHKP